MGPRLLALSVSGMMACAAPALAADTIRVMIDKLKFEPAQVSAHVGDTIEWVSGDFVAHTATARNKDWDVAIPREGDRSRHAAACRRRRLFLSLSSEYDGPDFGGAGVKS